MPTLSAMRWRHGEAHGRGERKGAARPGEPIALLLAPSLLVVPPFWHSAPVSFSYFGQALLVAWIAFRQGASGGPVWTAPMGFAVGSGLCVLTASLMRGMDCLPLFVASRPIPLALLVGAMALGGWFLGKVAWLGCEGRGKSLVRTAGSTNP